MAYFAFPSDADHAGTGKLKVEWEKSGLSPQPRPDVSDLIEIALFLLPRTRQSNCANCDEQRARDFMYEDVVPITFIPVDCLDDNPISKDLIQEGTIRTIPKLEPANVEPFLKEHLK